MDYTYSRTRRWDSDPAVLRVPAQQVRHLLPQQQQEQGLQPLQEAGQGEKYANKSRG
jgi:hypothetical protein